MALANGLVPYHIRPQPKVSVSQAQAPNLDFVDMHFPTLLTFRFQRPHMLKYLFNVRIMLITSAATNDLGEKDFAVPTELYQKYVLAIISQSSAYPPYFKLSCDYCSN